MRTKAELEYFIAKKGLASAESLSQRVLTDAEIRRMPEPVYSWHYQNNRANLDRALEAKPRNKPVPPAFNEQRELAEKLFHDYPQLLRTSENAAAIDSYLAAMPNPTFTFSDFREAFEKQTLAGRLMLNPSACDAGDETEVTGHRLRTHPNLYKMLASYTAESQERERTKRMSAADYKKEHPEAFDSGKVPPMIENRFRQAVATLLVNHPELVQSEENAELLRSYLAEKGLPFNVTNLEVAHTALREAGELKTNSEAVVTSGQTKLIDLGGYREPGYPPRSRKSSFQQKIDGMTADELKQRMAIDPAFRDALDGLSRA